MLFSDFAALTLSASRVVQVLALATQSTDHPDLRDRGYIYWRLLSTDPEGAKTVVLADKPTIEDDTNQTEPALLNDLISQLSNLASVYHKRPQQFVDRKKVPPRASLRVSATMHCRACIACIVGSDMGCAARAGRG